HALAGPNKKRASPTPRPLLPLLLLLLLLQLHFGTFRNFGGAWDSAEKDLNRAQPDTQNDSSYLRVQQLKCKIHSSVFLFLIFFLLKWYGVIWYQPIIIIIIIITVNHFEHF
ncbi:hypothetical protein PanWU01x14_109230, partial [Parasponia andersonii]